MFALQEVIDAVKDLASADLKSDLSHCQLLNARVRELGYQSFHHFRETLRHIPPDRFGNVSLQLMRQVCAARIPTLDCAYYEFQVLPRHGVGFYSHWIGWDKHGDEVRVPRPLIGTPTASGLRRIADYPIYVVESEKELLVWKDIWRSTALVPENIAKSSFPLAFKKEHLVEKNPPLERIRAQVNQYGNNIAYA